MQIEIPDMPSVSNDNEATKSEEFENSKDITITPLRNIIL